MKPKQFTVITVSANANSFGLKSILILAADGEGWQLLQSAYGGTPLPEIGAVLDFESDGENLKLPRFHSYECPRKLQTLPKHRAAAILKETSKWVRTTRVTVPDQTGAQLEISFTS